MKCSRRARIKSRGPTRTPAPTRARYRTTAPAAIRITRRHSEPTAQWHAAAIVPRVLSKTDTAAIALRSLDTMGLARIDRLAMARRQAPAKTL
jgi:hypothetical protein